MTYKRTSHRLWLSAAILSVLSLVIGLGIVPLEKAFDRSTPFETYEDGLWWAVTTVTGVGYGDYYPVTSWGRLLGAILETVGVTTFGLIIAFITIFLLRGEQQFYWRRTTAKLDNIEKKLEKIRKEQAYLVREKSE